VIGDVTVGAALDHLEVAADRGRTSSSGIGGFSKPSRVPRTERSLRIRKIAIPARTRSWIRDLDR
jgi:hypothetical protein